MVSKLKNIIFDLGGVILDIDLSLIYNELKNIGFTNHALLESPEVKELLDKFEMGIYSAPTFRNKMRSCLQVPQVSDANFDFVWNAVLLDIPKERIQAIESIKQHYNIFLMSNSNEIHYDLYVRDLQLRFGYREFDALFDKSYFSFAVHMTKPDPRFFEFVLDQHGMKPEETLFIDDTKTNIEAAQKLGIHTYNIGQDELVRNLFDNGVLRDDVVIG
ncbi:MAG: HAD family hydrolase [Candidatus Limimorpha sp.]